MMDGGSTWNFASIGLAVSEEKKFANVESEWPWTLTFNIHIGSCTHLVNCNSFWQIHCFMFFLYKSTRDQIWPCRKIGQGQPRVIIWANLVVLEHSMLHTKIQGHILFSSGEDGSKFLPYMGMTVILVMLPGPFVKTFVPPSQRGSTWNFASIVPLVSVEKMFENEPTGWGELKLVNKSIIRVTVDSIVICFHFQRQMTHLTFILRNVMITFQI